MGTARVDTKRHVTALDGVRGLAILAVVAYHVTPAHVPFGTIGVTVFFVLSGFLITGLMLREREARGRFDYLAFYGRRALRLYPALILAVLGGWALQVLLRDPQAFTTYPAEALVGFLYLGDIAQPMGMDMPMLGHTWSLAVEEQFYLVWPALFVGVLFVLAKGDHRRLGRWVLGAAAVSLAWRLGVTLLSSDPVRMYFAPDTNAFALLLGGALAISGIAVTPRRWMAWASSIALVVLAVIPVFDRSVDGWRLTMVIGTAAALIAAILVWSAPTAGRLLENRVLVWIGRVSYGWYLWHQIIWGLQPFGRPFDGAGVHVVIAVAALVPTALSYYLVERPLQRRFKRYVQPRALAAVAPGERVREHRDVLIAPSRQDTETPV